MAWAACALGADADTLTLSIDAGHSGARIDRNIFGQFAEHLGHCVSCAFRTCAGPAAARRSLGWPAGGDHGAGIGQRDRVAALT
jgi:hypothetical protein